MNAEHEISESAASRREERLPERNEALAQLFGASGSNTVRNERNL